MQYKSSDAWILLSVIYAGIEQAASLSRVIATADFINHAIVTFEEMEEALARLAVGDFIVYNDGKLSPSRRTMAFYVSITKSRRPVYKELEDIQRMLDVSCLIPSIRSLVDQFPSLTREYFEESVKEYLSWSKKTHRRDKRNT